MIYKLQPTRVYRAYYGGYNLDMMQNVNPPEISRFPEDWLASVTIAYNPGREVKNEGLSKTDDGQILKTLIEADKEKMIGKRSEMSLLFKLLDSSERLAIQVHPTVDFAKNYFNSPYGKTECWYMLNDGGEVYLGFKEGITKEYWKSLFESQDTEAMLECMHKFSVKKGDFIFVEGGVPHAIGKNCFLAELQEPTDLMVIPEKVTPSGIELPDQKLHCGLGFEKMFDCFEYNGMSKEETYSKYFIKPKKTDSNIEVLADSSITDKFRLFRIKVNGSASFVTDSYAVAVAVYGSAEINSTMLVTGDRIFISENENNLNINGNAEILICMP